jgi:hypothetical protein
MALIKHRPRIRLLLAPEVRPGEEFVATVVIDAKREVPIENLVVELTGTERGTVGGGKSAVTQDWNICRLRAVLSDATTIQPGKTEYKCRFAIPAGAPPSYRGPRGASEYLVAVRAAISWWPDAKRTFEINVGTEGDEPVHEGKAVVFSSRPQGPRAREPHVECSLASNVVAQGGIVSGAVALGNVDFNRYDGIQLAIRGLETIHLSRRRTATTELRRYSAAVVTHGPPEEGKPYPFRIRLPSDPPPSYTSRLWSLAWEIEVRSKISWASDMRITVPIVVVPKRFRKPPATNRLAPPDVGSDRLQKVWAAVAEETDLVLDGAVLRGTAGDVRLVISRDHRGRQGIRLVATLSFPSLGLGLSIQPYRTFQWGTPGIDLGDRRFDKEHHVTSRENAQGGRLLAPFSPSLTAFRDVEMSDTDARLEARGAGASKTKLRAFAEAALAVARGLASGPNSVPPPVSMAGELSAWRALASDLDGRLSVADMRITATILGMTTTIRTVFDADGGVSGTVVELALDRVIDEAHRMSATGETVDSFDALPDHAAPLARRVFGDADNLVIEAEHITLTMIPRVEDPRRLAGRARSVAQLATALLGGAGPYR